MPPKAHRGSSGHLRSHSRSSSSSKLAANTLQFTQKEPPPTKHTEKAKKANYVYDAHPKAAPVFARVNSSQRVHSREFQAAPPKRAPPPQRPNGTKPKAGFTIASQGNEDEDEDEWVSSESGAATPSRDDSDSDTASETDAPHPAHNQPLRSTPTAKQEYDTRPETPIPRVDTARQFDAAALNAGPSAAQYPQATRMSAVPAPASQPPQPPQNLAPSPPPQGDNSQLNRPLSEPDNMSRVPSDSAPQSRDSPQRPTSKRYSVTRPPSTHSISSRGDHALRPHPLIRGQSYGQVSKPAPLAPLTVTPHATLPQISTTPPSSVAGGDYMNTSPTSTRTSLASPGSIETSDSPHDRRRTSFSSSRSVSTIPGHSTFLREQPPRTYERNRTFSTVSSSSSSAALSSLAHLPAVTRPPSPQTISFFPPANPHVNIDLIHPLLPSPYLNNHLTVLQRRTPIRESFDRVIRAKQAAR